MRFPWASRTEEEQRKMDEKVEATRKHLQSIVHDLNQTLDNIQTRRKEIHGG